MTAGQGVWAEHPYDGPLPAADEISAPFWDSLRDHQLQLQSCVDCHTLRHPPSKLCRTCQSERSEWVALSGRGTVYTYVAIERSFLRGWSDRGRYYVVVVQPDEIPDSLVRFANNEPYNLLYGNWVDADDLPPVVGARVEAVFFDATPDTTVVNWRPRTDD